MTDQELKEQAAVMLAYANAPEGKKPRIQARPYNQTHGWQEIAPSNLMWSHNTCEYRLAPSPIAPGHNPDKLTVEQVGDGWRLLSVEEQKANSGREIDGLSIWRGGAAADGGAERWDGGAVINGTQRWFANADQTFRTKNPPGFYLPKPKIAAGHNPDKLTVDQIPEGRRLMTEEEVQRRTSDSPLDDNIHGWISKPWGWSTISHRGYDKIATYSVPIDWKDPLLKKKVRKPCGPEHFPFPTLVRRPESEPHEYYLVSIVESDRAWLGNTAPHKLNAWYFMDYTRSLDNGKTWLPCYVEVEE